MGCLLFLVLHSLSVATTVDLRFVGGKVGLLVGDMLLDGKRVAEQGVVYAGIAVDLATMRLAFAEPLLRVG
jgi:hypothetical protein